MCGYACVICAFWEANCFVDVTGVGHLSQSQLVTFLQFCVHMQFKSAHMSSRRQGQLTMTWSWSLTLQVQLDENENWEGFKPCLITEKITTKI